MQPCATCGTDVSGKRFCPQCGAPVPQAQPLQPQPPTVAPGGAAAANGEWCPRCGGQVRAGAAFCSHCGQALRPAPSTASTGPTLRLCPQCHAQVAAHYAFCTNCGVALAEPVTPRFCPRCGQPQQSGARFCSACGADLNAAAAASAPAATTAGPYPVPPPPATSSAPGASPYPAPTPGSPAYAPPVAQTPVQYGGAYPVAGQPAPGPINAVPAGSYPPQTPLVLRCPVCWAISPIGTSNCPGCRTSLVGVAPIPATTAQQPPNQQGGGPGGLFQGDGGKLAMGALGGAAAVIGGEMLLHGLERSLEGNDYGYPHHRHHHEDEGGVLGDLGRLADDVGLI
ncbi:zinc ribbon domain-containing protein [Thermogemmatispora onikobensis]|uniref:zinc ribbon domain-containing protein n=1 Tax=Thermogemmatispora onikobensis TaxID=732234 RepID=UPI000852D12A|nr:zinc ribbon domain-containing protein [Thermogemmatispora onikobensis]